MTILLSNRPGEFEKLLEQFEQVCNIDTYDSRNIIGPTETEHQTVLSLGLNFSPSEIPEYKLLSGYQILKTFLMLHYEGYTLHATPIEEQHTIPESIPLD
jgi:hypothetical protein